MIFLVNLGLSGKFECKSPSISASQTKYLFYLEAMQRTPRGQHTWSTMTFMMPKGHVKNFLDSI